MLQFALFAMDSAPRGSQSNARCAFGRLRDGRPGACRASHGVAHWARQAFGAGSPQGRTLGASGLLREPARGLPREPEPWTCSYPARVLVEPVCVGLDARLRSQKAPGEAALRPAVPRANPFSAPWATTKLDTQGQPRLGPHGRDPLCHHDPQRTWAMVHSRPGPHGLGATAKPNTQGQSRPGSYGQPRNLTRIGNWGGDPVGATL